VLSVQGTVVCYVIKEEANCSHAPAALEVHIDPA
jgi:hypothetical protein